MNTDYTLKLKDMTFYGYHGVCDAERKVGQRFIVDVEIKADLEKAAKNDCLEHTVNYEEIFLNIKKLVSCTKFFLIESLGLKIADYILESNNIVNQVKVTVKKPQVPIPDMTGYSEVEIIKNR
ncbi:MAG: dihydroneopterin aldolase [Candidatus Muiribacteriota bacterium]